MDLRKFAPTLISEGSNIRRLRIVAGVVLSKTSRGILHVPWDMLGTKATRRSWSEWGNDLEQPIET